MSEQCGHQTIAHENVIYMVPRRTNRVRRIHRSRPFELFVKTLEADGCVIVEDFVNPQILQRVQGAEEASLEHQVEERQPRLMTVDINSLIRESLLSDTLFQTLASHFLTLETISWHGRDVVLNTAKPRVSSSSTRDLNSPSYDTASFHRTDSTHHIRHYATSTYEYQPRRETNLGLLVPELGSLSASIRVNTVPGSHYWDDQKPDLSKGVKEIELAAGEAMILLGSLYHPIPHSSELEKARPIMARTDSGSWSSTPKEQLVHEVWMCSGIHRPANEIEKDSDDFHLVSRRS